MSGRDVLWKRYAKLAKKIILLVKKTELEFNVTWLNETLEWIEKNKFITGGQKKGIDNVFPAVKNMVRYKKIKEKRKGKS